MNVTKVSVKNLYGIKTLEINGKSVEVTGKKGTGKTSLIDSIRLALTNKSDRDWVLREGADEGEVLLETDSGLSIMRKKRKEQNGTQSIKECGHDIPSPQNFLNTIFTPLQLNPVHFTLMNRQEQNREILNLIEYNWDLAKIEEWFGEIPKGVDYSQHILEVLENIQSKKGAYYQGREDINRDIRNKKAIVEEIASDIPANYDYDKWNEFNLDDFYNELSKAQIKNSKIEKCKMFKDSYNDKKRGHEAEKTINTTNATEAIGAEKASLGKSIEQMKAEIKLAENKITNLDDKLASKIEIINNEFINNISTLDTNLGAANMYADNNLVDISDLQANIDQAKEMIKHINEYGRMTNLQIEAERLMDDSAELTRKIELARELPGTILKESTIPVQGLTVKNGIPLINGLPISNLSDGQKLDLCIDVTISKPGNLGIILIDGAERLDSVSRKDLYDRCKEKGLQIVATRTTDDDELNIIEL